MSKSNIEWTGYTWNFIGGCTFRTQGCQNCYALRDSWRIMHMEKHPERYNGIAEKVHLSKWDLDDRVHWTGRINVDYDAILKPLAWKKPRTIFVCSMSDLFHSGVPDKAIDKAWSVMARCQQHTFQVLTKRPERMMEYLSTHAAGGRPEVYVDHGQIIHYEGKPIPWPLPNVHIGVSVCSQVDVITMIKPLLKTSAAVRYISFEPLLGRIGLGTFPNDEATKGKLHWAIIGAESGTHRRSLDWAHVRHLVAQLRHADIPVFIKQLDINGKLSKDPSEWPEDLRILREWPNV